MAALGRTEKLEYSEINSPLCIAAGREKSCKLFADHPKLTLAICISNSRVVRSIAGDQIRQRDDAKMKKSFLTFIAVISGLLGCSANDDRDSISGARFEFNCDALIDDGAYVDGLWKPRNYSGSGVHLTTEEVAEAIARCKSVQLADQNNDNLLDWDSFAFNGRIYYHVPLANDVPSN